MPFFKTRYDPKGKFCFVTGGSTGLGRAIAAHLIKNGASDVVIVARSQATLDEAESSLKALAGPNQKVSSVSADLSTHDATLKAIETARERHGRLPEEYFCCAGFSRPRLITDMTEEHFKWGMDGNFWVQAWTAFIACRMMVAERIKGRVVLVGSFLSYASYAGYASYSPAKYALRGLADSLRSEMLFHDIDVTMFNPAGIDSPGYVEENKGKPAVTIKIEESDEVISPEACAGHLMRGLERGYYQPTTFIISELMRVASQGGVPGNNRVLDFFLWIAAGVFIPIYIFVVDGTVRGFKKQVQADLEKKGYYKRPA